jgi:hypothetical protein
VARGWATASLGYLGWTKNCDAEVRVQFGLGAELFGDRHNLSSFFPSFPVY